MERVTKKRPKRTPLSRNEKNMILNIYNTLRRDNPHIQLKDTVKQTAAVAGNILD